MTNVYIPIPHFNWREAVSTASQLPPIGNQIGDAIITQDTLIIYVWNGTSWQAITDGGSPGTVTSVGLAVPGLIYSVSGSPVTTSGTLTLNLISQTANTFLAAPNGSNGNPSFRSIVYADLPNPPTKTIAASYSVLSTDYYIFCNASGAITVTLPSPTAGQRVVVKDISGTATANNITIAPHTSEQIEGLSSNYLLSVSYQSAVLISDGTNWWIQ